MASETFCKARFVQLVDILFHRFAKNKERRRNWKIIHCPFGEQRGQLVIIIGVLTQAKVRIPLQEKVDYLLAQ